MLKEHAKRYYLEDNCNCAEAMLLAANDEYGLGLTQEACKIVGGFGGGLGCGSTCGALLGAVSVLGMLKMGRRAHETEGFREQCAALTEAFRQKLGHLDCADLKPRYANETCRCWETVKLTCEVLEGFLNQN